MEETIDDLPPAQVAPDSEVAPGSGSMKLPQGYGRIIRDDAGNVLRVELPEQDQEGDNTNSPGRDIDMETLEPDVDQKVLQKWVADLGGSETRRPTGKDGDIVKGESCFDDALHFPFYSVLASPSIFSLLNCVFFVPHITLPRTFLFDIHLRPQCCPWRHGLGVPLLIPLFRLTCIIPEVKPMTMIGVTLLPFLLIFVFSVESHFVYQVDVPAGCTLPSVRSVDTSDSPYGRGFFFRALFFKRHPGPLGCADLHYPSALAYNGLLRFNSG